MIRPWKPEEVPVGAVVRLKRQPLSARLIVAWTGFEPVYNRSPEVLGRIYVPYDIDYTDADCEWRWPHEADDAWRECGVEE